MERNVRISLRAARVNAGLTQKEASGLLHIGTSTLQGYESGKRVPRWDLVNRMQELYGIECGRFFFGDNTA